MRWTPSMDARLLEWFEARHGTRRPDAVWVDWVAAAQLFENVSAAQVRKRYMGVISCERREHIGNEEAKRLVAAIEQHGFRWEEIAADFEGRTGLQLRNYFYTAKRRFERRNRGRASFKYPENEAIDAFVERLAAQAPEPG